MTRTDEIRTALHEFNVDHISSIVVEERTGPGWFATGPMCERSIDRARYDALIGFGATRKGWEQRIRVRDPGRGHSLSVQCAGAQAPDRCALWINCRSEQTGRNGTCLCGSKHFVDFHIATADVAHEARRGPVCAGCGKDACIAVSEVPGRGPTQSHVIETVDTTFIVGDCCWDSDERIAKARTRWPHN